MKAWKIAIPVILVLVIGALAFLYFYVGVDFSSDYYISAGDRAMENGRLNRAVTCYTKALRSIDDDPELVKKLSDAYVQQGNYTKAEYTLVSGINRMPDDVSLYVDLSRVYVAQDKLRDAAILLDGVVNDSARQQLEALRPTAPTISPESGVYDEFFTVSVSYPSGCTAYVSTDGDFPSTAHPSVTEEITTTYGTNTIYAVSVSADGLVSPLIYAEYEIANVVEDVTFTDPVIEDQVRTALDVEDYVQLTTEDLWAISLLYIPSDVMSLEDLHWFSKLPSIQFETAAGFDFTALSNCPQLRKVVVANCGLTSTQLEQICQVTGLTYLDISGNQIVNLDPVANLTGLTALIASGNSIFDISPLAGLNGITRLDLSDNSIESVSPLWSMTAMTDLNLSGNPLTGIDELSGMDDIASMKLTGCGINDISSLAGKTKLTYLDVSDNYISSLDVLADSKDLSELYANNNAITSITFVSGLRNLSKLYASGNAITSVPNLSDHTLLNIIDLSSNLITDVSGITNMELLNYLYLDYNQISDVSCLTSNYLLVRLDVFGNPVTETSMLTDMGVIVNKGVIENTEEAPAEEAPAE